MGNKPSVEKGVETIQGGEEDDIPIDVGSISSFDGLWKVLEPHILQNSERVLNQKKLIKGIDDEIEKILKDITENRKEIEETQELARQMISLMGDGLKYKAEKAKVSPAAAKIEGAKVSPAARIKKELTIDTLEDLDDEDVKEITDLSPDGKSKLFNEMVEDNKAIEKEIGVLFKYL
ncbi:MAG: hypothetical protein CL470_09080 [Acidimicrobiaceae bacterium]|nr:hypothetical protein [Acidimicrobiaceae bacterium]|tara:strand:- start:463 stop:993 length:531 start_codon:yes stop_codon:yes gene_type:complete